MNQLTQLFGPVTTTFSMDLGAPLTAIIKHIWRHNPQVITDRVEDELQHRGAYPLEKNRKEVPNGA